MQRKIQGYLSQLRTGVPSCDFTEEQLLAYFTRDNTRKIRLIWASCAASLLFFLMGWQYYPPLALSDVLALGVCLVVILMILFQLRIPTDEEYDAWVQKKAEEELQKALEEADKDDLSADERKHIPCVQGYALRGTKDAKKYLPEDIHWKAGKDGRKRYSINIFTYVLPLEHRITVMRFHVNALNHRDCGRISGDHFYSEVVFVRIAEENELITVEEKEGEKHYLYKTRSFIFGTTDGHSVNVTIRSIPLSHQRDLPEFDFTRPDVELTIRQLRRYIRSIKEKGA